MTNKEGFRYSDLYYALCIQMFRRNPIHAFTATEHASDVHHDNLWHVLSYYDGMCINTIRNLSQIIDNTICVACTQGCTLKEMAIHCERKRLYLLSKNEMWKRAWSTTQHPVDEKGRVIIEKRLPFVAVIGIKRWNQSQEILNEAISEALSESFFRSNQKNNRKHFNGEIWYHTFLSLGLNDNYILLYLDKVDHIEAVVSALQYCCTKRNILIKTYSTFGINKKVINTCRSLEKKRYLFSIRLLTLPGLETKDTMKAIRRMFRNNLIKASIKSIMGSYDIEIYAHLSLKEYSHLLETEELMGWKSHITLRSNSHIHFLPKRKPFSWPTIEQQKKQINLYNNLVEQCRNWLNEQHTKLHDELKLSSTSILHENFLSVYTLACQKLASPQTWNQFADVRRFFENYLLLLSSSLHHFPDRRSNIDGSIAGMTKELYVLANERLSIETPSSERIGNSIYEKGAYEKVIHAWTLWLNQLYKSANVLIEGSEVRPASFMIIPYMYGQTKSLNHLGFNHLMDAPRSIVITLSVREMFRVNYLLLTLAHEVGHYCAITQRTTRVLFYILCVCTSSVLGTHYIWRPDGGITITSVQEESDEFEFEWMMKLNYALSDYLVTEFEKIEYLDECAVRLQDIVYNAFVDKGSVEEISIKLRRCFLKYCPALCENNQTFDSYGYRLLNILNRRCKEFISIFREINADLFMLFIFEPSPLSYLEIIVDQANTYLDFDSLLEQIEWSFDSQPISINTASSWFTLYMRLFCCIICFYIRSKNENLSDDILLSELTRLDLQSTKEGKTPNIHRLLQCLSKQANKLNNYEIGDSFCLQYLCKYGQLVLEQFKQNCNDSITRLRSTYHTIIERPNKDSIATLYCFLEKMETMERG